MPPKRAIITPKFDLCQDLRQVTQRRRVLMVEQKKDNFILIVLACVSKHIRKNATLELHFK